MKLKTLHDLYVNELKDLYNAEQQILKALPKMIPSSRTMMVAVWESWTKQRVPPFRIGSGVQCHRIRDQFSVRM